MPDYCCEVLPASAFLGFFLIVTPLAVTPGASFTLVSARGVAGDRRGAWATIAGTAAGIATHAVLAGVGLAAAVMRSAEVYIAIRILGAAYLIGLGVVLMWQSRRTEAFSNGHSAGVSASVGVQARRAYVANVLNVKAASVYLTLAPQFIPAFSVGVVSMLLLATVHILVMAAWLGIWSTGLTALASHFDPQSWRRRIDALGGAVLVFLGIRSVAEIQ